MGRELLQRIAGRVQLADVVCGDHVPLHHGVVAEVDDLEAERACTAGDEPDRHLDRRGRRLSRSPLEHAVEQCLVAGCGEPRQPSADDPLRIEPRQSGERRRCRVHATVSVDQHRDRGRVLHDRLEARDVARSDLPAAAFADVAAGQHHHAEVVVEVVAAHHLEQAPGATGVDDADLDRRADGLGLHRLLSRCRDRQVVGVDQVERTAADPRSAVPAVHLRGLVDVDQARIGIDRHDHVGERIEQRGRVRRQAPRAMLCSAVHHAGDRPVPGPGINHPGRKTEQSIGTSRVGSSADSEFGGFRNVKIPSRCPPSVWHVGGSRSTLGRWIGRTRSRSVS